jgi:GT2 family glycosyltransferase
VKEISDEHFRMVSLDDLAVVLLNWEHASQTLDTITMLSSWKGLHPLIVVVDNGSSDSDRSILQEGAKGHCLILNSYNRGFGGGNNDGISLALAKGRSKILLLNTDATVTEDCVLRLATCLNTNPEIGVISPLLEVQDKTFAGGRDIGLYSNTQILFKGNRTVRDITPVDHVSGTVLLARAQAYKEAGPLVEDYFFSGEIADFCFRIRRSGYTCAVYTKCIAIHKTEITFLRKNLYPYYSIRNRFLYVRRNKPYFSAVFVGKWIITGVLLSFEAYLRGNRSLSRSLLLAVKDGVRGKFGDQHQRVLAKICPGSPWRRKEDLDK